MSDLKTSTIAENIKNHMRRLGMKQAPLAKAIGVSQQQLSYLLSGKRSWTMHRLHLIAAALGLPVKELLEENVPTADKVKVTLHFTEEEYSIILEESKRSWVKPEELIRMAIGKALAI
jgi:transcriptional regulator with XRE-family HTH domain